MKQKMKQKEYKLLYKKIIDDLDKLEKNIT